MWDHEATEGKAMTGADGGVVDGGTAGLGERLMHERPRQWLGEKLCQGPGDRAYWSFDAYSERPDDKLEVAVAVVVLFVPCFGSLSENVVPFPPSGVFSKFFGLLLLIGF